MWNLKRKQFTDAVEAMENMENQLNYLMDNFGSRIKNTIVIEDEKFNCDTYDLDLTEIESQICRLRELINQYISEEDEYYNNGEAE